MHDKRLFTLSPYHPGAVELAQAATPTPVATSTLGLSRAEPVPFGETVLAGPVELRIREMVIGADAVAAVLAAAPTNVEPREGTTYVVVRMAVRNAGTHELDLSNDDFALTGSSGLLYRFLGVAPPAPALDVSLAPGESAEGWIAFGVPIAEESLLLLFNSLSLGGTWADRMLALQDGAQIADSSQRAAETNALGTSAAGALGIGETAVTDQWSVALLDVVSGAPAFDLVDYR
ncbi:MAG: DUF4352 domain-containing protein, partial [Chloroflexia bacterium]|nr:DUF4352 domain-containing protein [Chloroflexia bacterium]